MPRPAQGRSVRRSSGHPYRPAPDGRLGHPDPAVHRNPARRHSAPHSAVHAAAITATTPATPAKAAHHSAVDQYASGALERQASEAGLDHDARQRWRAEHAKPKLDELDRFLKTEQQQLLPNTPTMAAIGYVQNHWPAFTRYLEHGQCVIDNNAAERALRVVAVGRKNWLFAGSERGGHAAGIFYTLIESAKANGHNPRVYLEDILRRLPTTLDKDIDTLLPHRWAPLANATDS